MDRILRYLLSAGNMTGSSLVLLVIAAFLLNLIGHNWWQLALGAYLGGYLPFAFREPPAHMPDGMSTADALEWLSNSVLPKLPPSAKPLLADILQRINDLMPRIKEMETQGLVEAGNRALLKQTITRLVPDAVEAYLRLPSAYARLATFEQGKTAQDLLIEQLTMLQQHVVSLQDNLLSSDVNNLLANGRLLQEKFQRPISPLK